MKKAVFFCCRVMPSDFYFIPTILYSWESCRCWMIAFIWGNIGLEVRTVCLVDFEGVEKKPSET